MKVACIAFTDGGVWLAQRLQQQVEGIELELSRGFGPGKADLRAWTAAAFEESDALLFIGAAGIAVRAIAPLVHAKTSDPAVVVMDETGQWAIPLLSGHIGGANLLARQLARASGGRAVLTTATDVRGLWAVDDWAARNDMHIVDSPFVKGISSTLLSGGRVRLYADVELAGELPEGVERVACAEEADVVVSWHYEHTTRRDALVLVPRHIVVGVGCRKGVSADDVEGAVALACGQADVAWVALAEVVSIDVKADEPGLRAFCRRHGLHFSTRTAEQLRAVEGSVASSGFVQRTVGVDNVCERAALSGGGQLVVPKLASDGVTVALACLGRSYGFGGEG